MCYKSQGNTTKNRGLKGVANTPRRVQSFSHLPRPRLSREELIRYLGDGRPTAEDLKPSNIIANRAPSPEVAVEIDVDVVGGKGKENGNYIMVGDSNQALLVTDMEGGKVAERGDVGESVPGGEVEPHRRIPRRWPSSADIGMITDGR